MIHLEECKTLIEYFETPSSEDGSGMDSNGHSQHTMHIDHDGLA